MSVLGKDLFDFQRSHTNTKVEFGASGYWVEMVAEMQPYGTVLTEILNQDVTPFQKLLDRLNTAVREKNYDDAPRAYMDMQKGMETLRDDALMEYDRAKRNISALWNNHR